MGERIVAERMYQVVVGASYSQFYFRQTDMPAASPAVEAGIAFTVNPGQIMFTSPLQDADLLIDAHVFEARPEPLDSFWRDVVEFSFLAGRENRLTGWEEVPGDLDLQLEEGRPFRLRFAVADFDTARETHYGPVDPENPLPNVVAVDFWPQPIEAPRIVVQETKGGRHWIVSRGLDVLRREIFERRPLTTELDRITEFADRAFSAYPDLIESTISDGGVSLASTAWMLNGGVTDDYFQLSRIEKKAHMEVGRARVAAILLERAKARQTPS